MTEGPAPAMQIDEAEKVYSKFWRRLKEVIGKHPKGRAYDDKGQFYPDPVPVAPPIGYVTEVSMFDRVREMIRRDASIKAAAEGFETFEEADDFDVDDDYEPFSPYELHFVEQAYPDGPTVRPEEGPLKEDPAPSVAPSKRAEPRVKSGNEPAAAPAAGSQDEAVKR